MKKKDIKINQKIYDRYSKLENNPIKKLENFMLDEIASKLIFDPKMKYALNCIDPNEEDVQYLTIMCRDGNFIKLSNGNRIHVLDFERLYKAIDPLVVDVLDKIVEEKFFVDIFDDFKKKDEKIDIINPKEFFNDLTPKTEYCCCASTKDDKKISEVIWDEKGENIIDYIPLDPKTLKFTYIDGKPVWIQYNDIPAKKRILYVTQVYSGDSIMKDDELLNYLKIKEKYKEALDKFNDEVKHDTILHNVHQVKGDKNNV